MATLTSLSDGSVVQFTRRFMGALVLDPVTFEDVEADRHAGSQAAIVVLLACIGGGLAAVGSSSMNLATFVAGMAMTLGAWVVWALLITTIGTHLFPEPQTSSRYGELLRTMGATAREMLLAAAANRWGVPADQCFTDNGKVIHKPTGRSLKFGDLAEDAAKVTPPANPKPKPESEWKLLGKPLARVDQPAKLNGSAVFGLDFSMPGMVCAAVKQSPVHGGAVASFDKSSVMNLPGVRRRADPERSGGCRASILAGAAGAQITQGHL